MLHTLLVCPFDCQYASNLPLSSSACSVKWLHLSNLDGHRGHPHVLPYKRDERCCGQPHRKDNNCERVRLTFSSRPNSKIAISYQCTASRLRGSKESIYPPPIYGVSSQESRILRNRSFAAFVPIQRQLLKTLKLYTVLQDGGERLA